MYGARQCWNGKLEGSLQAWWSELITEGVAPPGRFAHAAAGAGDTMYMVGGYAQGQPHVADQCCTALTALSWALCC